MKAFLSSTYKDLVEYRAAAKDALERLDTQVGRMEVFGARPEDAIQASLHDLEKCDIFVGIYAYRYGYIPEDSTISVTEQEYDHAKKLKIPMFCFTVDPNQPWIQSSVEDEPGKSKIINFKKKINTEFLKDVFTTPKDLAFKVSSAVGRYYIEQIKDIRQVSTSSPMPVLLLPELFKGEKEFFVGRAEYIDLLIRDRLIKPGSKVSLVGVGGSGKSQLAFKAIRKYVQDGLFDLAIPIYFDVGIIQFEKFLSDFAEKTGLKVDEFEKITSIEDLKGTIRNLLSKRKHPLIYLDNFETISQVVNGQVQVKESELAAAENTTDFLNNVIPSSNTSVLLTSTNRINNITNEDPLDLEGLSLEDSIKLFNAFVRTSFKNPSQDVKEQIKELLEKTGGHPLSIEIIAKNIKAIDQLKDLSRILGPSTKNRGEQIERFKSLQASLGYINNRLDANLQKLLPKLTYFNSPFPLSAAGTIFDSKESDIVDLFDRSLLIQIKSDEIYGKIDDQEYWLYSFQPAVRNYLETQKNNTSNNNDSNFATDYGERFSSYYYNLLESTYYSIGKDNHVPSLARFNIINQGEDNDFERAIQLTTNKQQGAYILSYLGLISQEIGMYAKAANYYKRSIAVHQELNDRVGMAVDYSNIGIALNKMGNYQQALDYHNKALEIDRELEDTIVMAADYANIGLVFDNMGRLEEALDSHIKALEISEQLNFKEGKSKQYNNIGLVLYQMGNYQQALDYHNKALETDKELNDRVGIARDYSNIGEVRSGMGNYQQALDYHNKALEIDKELNYRVGIARDYNNIGSMLSGMGNYQQALDYHNKALEIQTELDDRVGMAVDYSNIGLVLYQMGNYQQALDYHNKALKIHEEMKDKVWVARDLYNINFVYVNMKRSQDALDCLHISLGKLEEFKKETNYHHPLLDKVNNQISYLCQFEI
jgi:tetratricopeptide (TPR) repeat protein